jgi:predicted membrane-bound spermidine synthase
MMFDSISESLNADFEDGSVGEVIIFSICLAPELGLYLSTRVSSMVNVQK